MNQRRGLICLAAILLLSRMSLAGAPVEIIRNEKVVVVTQTLAAGQTLTLPADHFAVLFYLDAGSIAAGDAKSAPVQRGEAMYQLPRGAVVKNTGSSDLRTVRIDYLGQGSSQTWGMTGLPPNYKVLFEDGNWRIYDIKIAAGQIEPQHTHHDRVVVCLSGAQLEHTLPDGKKEPSSLKTDEIAWRLGATHVGHNIGTTDLWVIAIEPK